MYDPRAGKKNWNNKESFPPSLSSEEKPRERAGTGTKDGSEPERIHEAAEMKEERMETLAEKICKAQEMLDKAISLLYSVSKDTKGTKGDEREDACDDLMSLVTDSASCINLAIKIMPDHAKEEAATQFLHYAETTLSHIKEQ